MSHLDIVGASENLFLGADPYAYDEVDAILSAGYPVDIMGAATRLPMLGRPLPAAFRPQAPRQSAPAAIYQNAMLAAAAAQRAQAGFTVRQNAPSKARRQLLGVNSTGTIAAGATVTLTARPQTVAFRPDRIVIPATLAPNFVVEDIKVGNSSQFVQSGGIPAEAFVQQMFDGLVEFDTVQTSQDFIMIVTNVSGAPSQFRAAVFGKSAS